MISVCNKKTMDWLRRLYRKRQPKNESIESLKNDNEFVDIVEGERKAEDEVGGLKDLIRSEAGVERRNVNDNDTVEVISNFETSTSTSTDPIPETTTDPEANYNNCTSFPPKHLRGSRKKQVRPQSPQLIRVSSSKNIIHQPR